MTHSGIEDQLLSTTIYHEQPQLERERAALLKKEEALHLQLVDFENQLLEDLASSQGNILENTQLIQSLEATKAKSTKIQEALIQSRELQHALDEKREVYRMVAEYGSKLFFALEARQSMRCFNMLYLVKSVALIRSDHRLLCESTFSCCDKNDWLVVEMVKRLGGRKRGEG